MESRMNKRPMLQSRERLLLEPLGELCSVRHGDVRARQLECAGRLLHCHGEQLGAAWPQMVEIIASISDHHSEQLIRAAFQCCQVVAGDLLGAAGPRCLRQVLHACAAFATQTCELNISLTAVGLMWNISDYLYHNHATLATALEQQAGAAPCVEGGPLAGAALPPLQRLWLGLYGRLSELCCSDRAPVRRAASQTLFSCVGAHGAVLGPPAWAAVLRLLLAMLHQVQKQAKIASSDKVDTGDHILIHHTRNTAQKQWAETQVLTLCGVARVFHSRFPSLLTVADFPRCWAALLDYITDFALTPSQEVSLAALKSFQEVVGAAGRAESDGAVSGGLSRAVWGRVWAAWAAVASAAGRPAAASDTKPVEPYAPSLNFLTTLLQIFPLIFQHIRTTFTPSDVSKLGSCVCRLSAIEPSASTEGILPVVHHSIPALQCLETLHKEALIRHELLPPLYRALTSLCAACGSGAASGAASGAHGGAAGRCLSAAAALYRAAPEPSCDQLPHLLQSLREAVKKCDGDAIRWPDQPDEATQIAALLLQTLATGLPLARAEPDKYHEFWETLPEVLNTFMFEPPVGGTSVARELVALARGEVLRARPRVPAAHWAAVMALVRQGALRLQPPTATNNEKELREREEFARTCFETLLQCSMSEDAETFPGLENDTDPLAIVALLDRFQEVISRYTTEGTNAPIPRHEQSEMSFVLTAVATLTESMKKAPPGKVDAAAWNKLIGIYPLLVNASGRAWTGGAGAAIRSALLQFGALLQPPTT